jgi:hypothetical protein
MKIKNFFRPLAGTALILVIPLLARWPWGILDFVVMGFLLFLTGVIMEVVAAKVEVKYRPAAYVLVVLAFLAIWAELAVDAVSQIISFIF